MLFFLKCGAKVIGYFEICNIFAEKIFEMDKILGLGNALVDVAVTLDSDEMLSEFGLLKGCMTLIDENKFRKISDSFSRMDTYFAPGGSAANVIRGLSHVGVATGFIGKIGKDSYGDFFKNSLQKNGTDARLLVSDVLPSGVASTFISRGGERTFGTYLGAAATLTAEELLPELFEGYTYLFIEGYLVQDHDMILRAIRLAKDAGLCICLDLASSNIVAGDLEFLSSLVNDYVDIVFANEEEAKAFTGRQPEEALDVIASMCGIAVVKLGAQGSLVRKGMETVHVPAAPVAHVIDTNAAGDLYAAGFLCGLANGYTLEQCGKIGSLLAGEIVQVAGTELPEETWKMINRKIQQIQ